jgi:uncharacterized metal-binding protein
MASGKNHDRGILLFTPMWTLTAIHYTSVEIGLVVGLSHFVGGWYLSPDLDLKSRPFLRWGVLKSIWVPYQNSIPHRHWLSHAPVIGSVVRLFYLAAWLSPLLLIPSIHRGLLSIGWEWLIAGFIGVELSAMNHLILDGLVIPLPKSVKKRLGGN